MDISLYDNEQRLFYSKQTNRKLKLEENWLSTGELEAIEVQLGKM